MSHNIPKDYIQKHTKTISDTKRTQVANLQKHIQGLLDDTHHTFLQGSYANDTCTSDIKDVDIVAVRKTTYSSVFVDRLFPTSISWESMFSEIEAKLKNQNLYQWTISRSKGGKCIEVKTTNFKADVVPAVKVNDDAKLDPIVIYSFKTGTEKINMPRTHIENGAAKHDATKKNYKPVVRMFKNWVDNHFGANTIISSYQIESLVHSVENENFHDDHAFSFLMVGNEIFKKLSIPSKIISVCGSEDVIANWNIQNKQLFNGQLSLSIGHALSAIKANNAEDAKNHWDKVFNL